MAEKTAEKSAGRAGGEFPALPGHRTLSMSNDDFSKIGVLVVDDDHLNAEMIEALLRAIGFTDIQLARNGNEAMAIFKEKALGADMIICDWLMPGMDGLEFLRQVRRIRPEIPFMMLSRRRGRRDRLAVKDIGVSAYLTKPFSPEKFTKKVSALAKKYLAEKPAK